jgi:excisionase family DNA binding protein
MTMSKHNLDRIIEDGVLLLSVCEVARVLSVHESRAYRLVEEGDLTVVRKAGRKRYVRAGQVAAYRRRRDSWLRMHGRTPQTQTA